MALYIGNQLFECGTICKLNIFIREVQFQFDQCGKLYEFISQSLQFGTDPPAHLAEGNLVRSFIFSSDQVGNGFCLSQVQLAVQKSSLGKLSRCGQAGTFRYA
ncbi:hypothetical protein D3C86_1296670 [compost metagenome]